MKRLLVALFLSAACAAPQVVPPEKPTEGLPPEKPVEGRPPPPQPPTILIEDGMRLEYRAHGRTVVEINDSVVRLKVLAQFLKQQGLV